MKTIRIEEVYGHKNCVFIDVRTSNEYEDGSIYGAVNVPIFNNEERAEIGYIYKNVNRQQAKELGLEIASKKLIDIYHVLKKHHDMNKKIIIFCARGGMRSGSLVSVMSLMSLNVCQLEGGYKAYRKFVHEKFEAWRGKKEFLVLRGGTGVGKTDLLKGLQVEGYNVLDLERMANHRGSVFGSIGLGRQSSQKTFESELFHEMYMMPEKPIFIEAESGKIGNRVVPPFAIEGIKKGQAIKVTCDIIVRAQRLLNEYKDCNDQLFIEEMLKALVRIRSYLKKEIYSEIEDALRQKDYEKAAILLLEDYYDPLYKKWEKDVDETIKVVDTTNIEKGIADLKVFYNNLNP